MGTPVKRLKPPREVLAFIACLPKAEGKKAIPCLIEGLHHVNEDVRIECAYMLADMPCREGVQALVGCLERDADLVPPPWALNMALHRMTAYGQYLPPSDRQGARDLWIPWWKEHETQLVNTQSGIGLRQDDGTVVPLPLESAKGPYDNLPARVNWDVRELKNPHPAMRAAAALGLGEIGDRAAVPFLVDALKDEQWLVRRDVATALGRIGDPRAVPALENALQDEETLVRSAAAEALQKIRQGGVRE